MDIEVLSRLLGDTIVGKTAESAPPGLVPKRLIPCEVRRVELNVWFLLRGNKKVYDCTFNGSSLSQVMARAKDRLARKDTHIIVRASILESVRASLEFDGF